LFNDFGETGGGICNTCGPFPNGFLLIAFFNGWSYDESKIAIEKYLDANPIPTSKIQPLYLTQVTTKIDVEKWKSKATEILDACIELTDPEAMVGRQYLSNRGVDVYSDVLRFDPNHAYYDPVLPPSYHPALIAPVENNKGLTSIHRTYLKHDGTKADVDHSKKLYPPAVKGGTKGSSIRLFDPKDTLAITEGIETALAVHMATQGPVWAAISATNMPFIEIPSSVRHVDIWADNDFISKAGQKAAKKLADRLISEGITTRILLPDLKYAAPNAKSVDWLDVLMAEV